MSVKGNKYRTLSRSKCSLKGIVLDMIIRIEICINEDINSIEDYARSYSRTVEILWITGRDFEMGIYRSQ